MLRRGRGGGEGEGEDEGKEWDMSYEWFFGGLGLVSV